MADSSNIVNEIAHANTSYADKYQKEEPLPGGPRRKVAILTCMDVRIDPMKITGLNLGDAHVIRNAGGRASDDAIRSLLVSHKFFGTLDWFVVQHTKCGMATVTDQEVGDLFAKSLNPASNQNGKWQQSESGCGSNHGHDISWLTITDLEESVRTDVKIIANHPLVARTISIHGYIYDVESGLLKTVDDAFRPGV